MKRFRIIAVLSLVLTLLPVRAFAAPPQTAPPSATPVEVVSAKTKDDVATEEVVPPTLDLVFCIDISENMRVYMPSVKTTIQSLIRRDKARYPGHTVRLGLVRYGDGQRRHIVLDLSEDEDRFLRDLNGTGCDVAVPKMYANLIEMTAEEMSWSKIGVHRLYMIGNGYTFSGPKKGLVAQNDHALVRAKNISVSTAYCQTRPFARLDVTDETNVQSWLAVEGQTRQSWIDLAVRYRGEVIHIFSNKDTTLATHQPILALVWEPMVLYRFHRYLSRTPFEEYSSFDDFQSRYKQRHKGPFLAGWPQMAGWPELGGRAVNFHGDENLVTRYFANNPSKYTLVLRP